MEKVLQLDPILEVVTGSVMAWLVISVAMSQIQELITAGSSA